MKWIDSSDIKNWANKREAQDHLPLLIRKLIHASVDVESIDIPAGSSVSTGGWDGIVKTNGQHTYVPSGDSVWEFGVDQQTINKAESDYAKRVKDPLNVTPADTHYVFVSPRAFTKNRTWAKDKSQDNVWKTVRAYNASDLEAWLNMCPSVSKWFSSQIGLHSANKVESLEIWWNKWSSVTNPRTSIELLINDRQKNIESFQELIEQSRFMFSIESDSLDESIAFIYCAANSLEQPLKDNFLSKAIIIRSKVDFDSIVNNYDNCIIIPVFPEFEGGRYALDNDHSLIVPVGQSKSFKGSSITLDRLSKSAFTKALETMEIEHQKAWQLAADTKRSLTVLRRINTDGQLIKPRWSSADAKLLVAMLLIGTFDSNNESDKQMASMLFNADYDEIDEFLQNLSQGEDPFVREIRGVWELISFRDAWYFLSNEIDDSVKERYRKCFLTVYSDENTRFLKELEERYLVSTNEQYKFSVYMRRSLKNTFALLALESDNQAYVDLLLGEVLNESTTWNLWASLRDELSVFAEAAPASYLRGISYLVNQKEKVSELYRSSSNALFGGHSLTGILWGLENIVWSEDYGEQAVILIAKLAMLDPEPSSNYVNRPINSLKEIFKYRHPQGNFSSDKRIELIEQIHSLNNELGWNIIDSALPYRGGGMASWISKPIWREYREIEQVTYGDINYFAFNLYKKAIELIQSSRSITIMLKRGDQINDDNFDLLVSVLGNVEKYNLEMSEKKTIWEQLERLVSSCEKQERENIRKRASVFRELADKYKPDDIIQINISWFSYDYQVIRKKYPEAEDYKEYIEVLDVDRFKVLKDIFEQKGVDGLIQMAKLSEDSRSIGRVVGGNSYFYEGLDQYLFTKANNFDDSQIQVYGPYIEKRVQKDRRYLDSLIDSESFNNEFKTKILLWCVWVDNLLFYIDRFEESDKEFFWERAYPYYLHENIDPVTIIQNYLKYDNPISALEFAVGVRKKEKISPKILQNVLLALAQHSPKRQLGTMDTFHIEEAFERLWDTEEVKDSEILQLEWAFLKLWNGYDGKYPKCINRQIASDPSFFVYLLSLAFKPRNAEKNDQDISKIQAENAYHALDLWNMVPGQSVDGEIDLAFLKEWVSEVRQKCETNDRIDICDQYIGKILAKNQKVKSYEVPDKAILEILNEDISKHVKTGFSIQFSNNRGVQSLDMNDPGKGARDLASICRDISKELVISYSKVSELYDAIANSFDHESKWQNDQSELEGY
ncbi:hypothetical protein ADMFC3_00120 [Geovibrio sp. ADMFC3]